MKQYNDPHMILPSINITTLLHSLVCMPESNWETYSSIDGVQTETLLCESDWESNWHVFK